MKKTGLILALFAAMPLLAVDITATKTAEQLATVYGWTTGGFYDSFMLNGVVTFKANQPDSGSVNGYYSPDSPRDWRMYQARNNGEFTVSVKSGFVIQSLSITYSTTKNGVLSLVPGSQVDSTMQIASGQVVLVNDTSITLYAANTGTASNGQVRMSSFSVTYSDSCSVAEMFSQVQQEKSAPDGTIWQGDLAEWKVMSARRAAKDTLNGGQQGTWTKANAYLTTSAPLEGGIRHIHFEWREFVNQAALLEMALQAGQWKDTASLAATGVFATSRNQSYDAEVACRQNTSLTISNISKQASASADRFLIGDLYITPYIYFPEPNRLVDVDQYQMQFDVAPLLLDNTEGEGQIVYSIVSDETEAATISGSVVDLSAVGRSGKVVVQASWNDGLVYTHSTLNVIVSQSGTPIVETFSGCRRQQLEGTTYVIGDNDFFDWNLSNFTHLPADTIATQQGFQLRHGGFIATNGAQEGGLIEMSFSWRAVQADKPVDFVVKVDGQSYRYTCTAEEAQGKVFTYCRGFSITHNTSFSISVEEAKKTVQTPLLVGPVSVTPYLLFVVPGRTDTVLVTDSASYDLSAVLLDNTMGEGSIAYSILSDETGAASVAGSVLDLSQVTTSGAVLVQAAWGQVTTTMTVYAEYATTALESVRGASASRARKLMRNNHLLILRDNQRYTVLGTKL